MVDDPNRKTARQFQCRDYLWESFEQMSRELECSVDYLVNEAMRQYLRTQGRPSLTRADEPSVPPETPVPGAVTNAMPAFTPPVAAPVATPAPREASLPGGGTPSAPGIPALPSQRSTPLMPPLPGARPAAAIPSLPNAGATGGRPPLPSLPGARPPASAVGAARASNPGFAIPTAPPATAPGPRVLHAAYDGSDVPVDKDEFFIGRGQKSCDLVIRDTNVSRQHARVIFHNGQHWIIDNQSTNGVDFRGSKIQQKRIDDGDVFTICGHDVRFEYR